MRRRREQQAAAGAAMGAPPAAVGPPGAPTSAALMAAAAAAAMGHRMPTLRSPPPLPPRSCPRSRRPVPRRRRPLPPPRRGGRARDGAVDLPGLGGVGRLRDRIDIAADAGGGRHDAIDPQHLDARPPVVLRVARHARAQRAARGEAARRRGDGGAGMGRLCSDGTPAAAGAAPAEERHRRTPGFAARLAAATSYRRRRRSRRYPEERLAPLSRCIFVRAAGSEVPHGPS